MYVDMSPTVDVVRLGIEYVVNSSQRLLVLLFDFGQESIEAQFVQHILEPSFLSIRPITVHDEDS